MKPLKWFVLVLFVLAAGVQANNVWVESWDVESIETCSATNDVFEHGERIVYKVYYTLSFVWIAAGKVVFEVKDKGDHYHITASGRTLKSYDWIFKVRDYYDSFIEKSTLRPTRTVRKVHEGKYRLYDDVRYQHQDAIALSNKGKSKAEAQLEEIALNGCTHDILSSIYTMRNLDFGDIPTGTKVPFNIYIDRKIYDLKIVYEGVNEQKRIKGLGQTNTLLFKPELVVGNVFKDNDGMNIWVSNDENRIPLMIESPISVGKVRAVLREHKGLKYPASF